MLITKTQQPATIDALILEVMGRNIHRAVCPDQISKSFLQNMDGAVFCRNRFLILRIRNMLYGHVAKFVSFMQIKAKNLSPGFVHFMM